jgi:hypothetical protein
MKPLTLGAIAVSQKRKFSLEINLHSENITAVAPTVKEVEPTLEDMALDKSSSNNPILKALAERLDFNVVRVEKTLEASREAYKKGNESIIGDWSNKIQDLENFFTSLSPQETPIKIEKGSIILDLKKFTESHLMVVKANNGKKLFLPYLERLEKVRDIIRVNIGNKKT